MPPVGSYPTLSPITCAGGLPLSGHRLVCSLLHLTWRRACAAPPLGLLARAAFPDPGSPGPRESGLCSASQGENPHDTAAGRTAQTLELDYTLRIRLRRWARGGAPWLRRVLGGRSGSASGATRRAPRRASAPS